MRAYITGIISAAVLAACLLCTLPGPATGAADDEGWISLSPGKELKGWKRVPIAPDTRLNEKNPWKVSADGKVLECDGAGVKEMLLHEREFADGVFHVEWRFRKVKGKQDYNGGIYVRTSADGKVWHQAQVAHLEKPPRMGDLFGETLVDGQVRKFVVEGRGSSLVRPPGEWNTFEITCTGPKVSVAVNGEVATTWNDCKVGRGHVGLQAEYFYLELRSLKFKPMRQRPEQP